MVFVKASQLSFCTLSSGIPRLGSQASKSSLTKVFQLPYRGTIPAVQKFQIMPPVCQKPSEETLEKSAERFSLSQTKPAPPFPHEARPTLSGYLPIGPSSTMENRLFYVFYEAENPLKSLSETPLLVWLNGGPGCSSLIGCFYELGPWRVTGVTGELERNVGAWNRRYGVLFIDNPIGTGFSVAKSLEDVPTDQPTIARHLSHAICTFFEENKENVGRPLYLTGESYAGKYIPWLGKYIMEKVQRNEKLPYRFCGAAIGNGFVDPRIQVQVHADVAHSLGLLDKDQAMEVQKWAEEVVGLVDKEEWVEAHYRRTELCEWIESTAGIPTLLDVRRDAKYHATEDQKEYLALFLNKEEVKQALKAERDIEWVSCRPALRKHLAMDTMKSSREAVEFLLSSGLPLLVYQGIYDAKDGPAGSEAWMRYLAWTGASDFWASERQVWRVGGRRAGYWREGGALTHVVVVGAGHQVPVDQPLFSQALIETWIEEKT